MSNIPGEVLQGFSCSGDLHKVVPLGNGHINTTFLGTYGQGNRAKRYVHQQINDQVFGDISALMENIGKVTRHLRGKYEATGVRDIERRVLQLVPTRDGEDFLRDKSGNYWRTYQYVEDTRSIDRVESPGQAAEVARAFGRFQALLADMPVQLNETISGFHDTRARYDALMQAISEDSHDRVATTGEEIAFARTREPIVDIVINLLAGGDLPERIIHNDTKPNNVLFDQAGEVALCVVDLDTVMPGTILYDFGDMVRSTTCAVAEDAEDLAQVDLDLDLFEALVSGYCLTAGEFLTPLEKSLLVFSGRLIALELGMRFLTDHLSGDRYFKADFAGQNLLRCRRQFSMAAAIERRQSQMERIVECHAG